MIRTETSDDRASLWSDDFFASLEPTSGCHLALNHLPGVRTVIKDKLGRFVWVSENVPARHGFTTTDEMLGLHDRDINPPALAEVYWRDDKTVLESGQSLLAKAEISFNEAGLPDWFVVNKVPLRNRRGEVCGLIAIISPHHGLGQVPIGSSAAQTAAKHIKQNLSEPLRLNDIAEIVGLSVRQLQRQFSASTGLTLSEYIVRCRVMEACRLLRESELQLQQIASHVGFYDQSAFNRAFQKYMPIRPLEYRRAQTTTRIGAARHLADSQSCSGSNGIDSDL